MKFTLTTPSRSLLGKKPLRYVNAVDTDIRRTFRRARLLARIRALASAGSSLLVAGTARP